MNELSVYRCEICKAVYESKEQCEMCEAFHVMPSNENITVLFEPMGSKDAVPYPRFINFPMNDGSIIRYEYHSVLKYADVQNEEGVQ